MTILMGIVGLICGLAALVSFAFGAWYSPYPFVFGGLAILMFLFAFRIRQSDKTL